MGRVLWHVTMSLDGFIAGPGDAMEWVFDYPGRSEAAAEVIETTGGARRRPAAAAESGQLTDLRFRVPARSRSQ